MKFRWGALIWGMAAMAYSMAGATQTAVIETNHHSWYNPSSYNGFTMTEGYAPLAVFFEGWKSSPRADIVEWRWDFGDGSPVFHGFNAGHVFKDPGTYTVTLTVETKTGSTASASTTVTVLERDGTTYYVDSETGNDANSGLSPDQAWRTGTHAFAGMNDNRYGPGDQVLFKRGQVFEIRGGVVEPSHWDTGWGYRFATYGEGPKPIMQTVGTVGGKLINQYGAGAVRITIQDLEFQFQSADDPTVRMGFWEVRERTHNLLFWNLNFYDSRTVVAYNGGWDAAHISNVFMHECTVKNDGFIQLYTKAHRVSLIGNLFDWAENHIHYCAWMNIGIVANNIHSRPAFGRTAFRLSAVTDDYDIPSKNVHFIHNYFGGHIDPLTFEEHGSAHADGERYNFEMLYLAPNRRIKQSMEDVIFEKNVITNCETAMIIGDYENLIVRDNLIITPDNYGPAARVEIGHKFEMRPNKNIRIESNTIYSNQVRSGFGGIFKIKPYDDIEYNGMTEHEGITITNNDIYLMGADDPVFWWDYVSHSVYKNDPAAGLAAINTINSTATIENNRYFKANPEQHGMTGGYWNSPDTVHTLSDWQNTYGQSGNATYLAPVNRPYPAQTYSDPTDYDGVITVEFDNGLDASRNPVPEVRLWVKKNNGNWADSGLAPQAGPGGSFTYTAGSAGKYYFATVTRDAGGNESIRPTDLPTPFANTWTYVYGTDGSDGGSAGEETSSEPDTTAPTPGVASSPDSTFASPVTVSYDGAVDESGGSGLKEVRLWVKQGSGGAWADTGLTSTGGSGGFSYAMPSFGTYYFTVQAEDNAGNISPAPTSGDGDTSTTYQEAPEGVMVHLELDDDPSDNVAEDSSGLGNDGFAPDAQMPSLTTAGHIDSAYDFTDDRIVLTGIDVGGTAFTLSGWVNADAFASFRRIVAKATGIQTDNTWWALTTESNGNIPRFQLKTIDGVTTNVVGTTAMQAGQWYHLAGVYDGTSMRLYVNGVEEASAAKSGEIATDSTVETWVGDAPPTGGRGWDGRIDDVRIYNVALSAAEVESLYTGDTPAEPAPDTTPPNPGTAAGPGSANAWPITVSYSGALDGDSGLASVTLWSRKDAGAWSTTGLSSAAASGSFSFAGTSDGVYYFSLVAEDNAGNVSALPSGDGMTSTVYDTTAPTTGTISLEEYSTNPVTVNYSSVSDGSGSGVQTVELWVRTGGGSWGATGLTSTNTSGGFTWSGAGSDGTYYFALRVVDNVSNSSPAPSGTGQGNTIVDSTPPNLGTLTSSLTQTNQSPIALDFSGVSDDLSGLKEVVLWFRKGAGGSWQASTLSSTQASGTFSFSGMSGDDVYYFALRAEDSAGNLTIPPSGSGAVNVRYDMTPPAMGTVSGPGEYANASPFTVSYSGVSDAGAGLKEVRLWMRKDTGAWSDTGDTRTTGSGSFSVTPAQGDGTYAFALQLEDNLGNISDSPSGSGQASVIYDAQAPTVDPVSGSESANSGPVDLTYSNASDTGSGIKAVHLWVRKPGSGWIDTGMESTTESGSFSYNDFTTDGPHNFAVQAEDNAGNSSPSPSGSGQHTLTYDATAPTVPTVTAPANANETPITVSYSGADDGGSGVKEGRLWVRKGDGGAWTDTGRVVASSSGSFDYAGVSGDDTYYFAVQVEDNAGNKSADPTSAQAQTVYDTTAPEAGTADGPEYASSVPVTVSYTAPSETAEARLWFRKGAGAWTDSGLVQSGASGSFSFNGITGDDTYYLAVQTEDNLGNVSDTPTGSGSDSTIFDTAAPTPPGITVDDPTGTSPIAVSYSGASDGSSGVNDVTLWVKQGSSGTWTATDQTATGESGGFSFTPVDDGTYFFAARVSDNAGNTSPEPSGSGAASTVYDSTAPDAGSLDAPGSASTTPIEISYAGVSDTGSGVSEVELWHSIGSDNWASTGQVSTASSDVFSYNLTEDNTYHFAIVVTDAVGNQSGLPSGTGMATTEYDSTPPSGAAVSAPSRTSTTPITVSYTGNEDVATAYLWFKQGSGGVWTNTGLSNEGPTGSFAFTGVSVDGTYYFAVQTADTAANLSPEPTGSGAASTVYDTTAPVLGTLTAPEYATDGSVEVSYAGVSDSGGSGLSAVQLWVRKGAGAWADSELELAGGSGSFTYTGLTGNDTYYFALQAVDKAGNETDAPSGDGLDSTLHDSALPIIGTLTGPESASSAPIELSYSGVSDSDSGLKEVQLWLKKGAGSWGDTGLRATEESGTFSFNDLSGDAQYYFALRAEDNAGNKSAAPAGDGLASTLVDTTPPSSASVTADQYANEAPITVVYETSDSNGSGYKQVHPWVRKGNGGWAPTGDGPFSMENASYSYSGMSGDDTYHFYFQVEDNAGNLSAAPDGPGAAQVVYDTIAPSIGTLTAGAEYDGQNPIELTFSGVSDTTSGLDSVELWAKRDGGSWGATGVTSSSGSGTLNYTADQGDGVYYFALRARDKAGNESPLPAANGSASTTFDTTPPTTGTLTSPEYASESPIDVSFSGVSDDGSGVAEVKLYVKKDSGSWIATSQTATTESGTFSYTVTSGDGTYAFAVRAKDAADNESAVPTSTQTTTRYDTTAPDSGTASAPEYANAGPVTVTYTGANDSGSGLSQVTLYVRKGGGAWTSTEQTSMGSSGSFSFNDFTGEDTYSFATRAENEAGVQSPEPSGDGDTSTIFDTTAPGVGTINAPAEEDAPPISILYSGVADTGGSGVDRVYLYVRKGAGSWTDTNLSSVGESGSFSYSDVTDDDTYYFALRTEDNAGNVSDVPAGDGQAATVLDTSFTGGTASSPQYATSLPIVVRYEGADAGENETVTVHLWVKQGAEGVWEEAGMSSVGASGQFNYEGAAADDRYYFAVQGENSAGERTNGPFGNGDTSTIYDTTPPTPVILQSAPATNQMPIVLEYQGEPDEGSGLKEVMIWVKKGFEGIWEPTDLIQSVTEGSFEYGAATEEDYYFFYLQMKDNAGLSSPPPSDDVVFGQASD